MVSWSFSVIAICAYLHFGNGARVDTDDPDVSDPAVAEPASSPAENTDVQALLDAGEEEKKLRDESPQLLTEHEHVELAYKKFRGIVYITNLRVLTCSKGFAWNKNKTTYRSVPYKSVKTYAIQTAGMIDPGKTRVGRALLRNFKQRIDLFTNMPSLQVFSLSFKKEVNIFDVGKMFASKILNLTMPPSASPSSRTETSAELFEKAGVGKLVAIAGSHAEQIDASEIEETLRTNASVLGVDEKIHYAFRVFRTVTLLTSRRIMCVHARGFGYATRYLSIPYEIIQAFKATTAGGLDLDSEFHVWTDLHGLPHFKQDLKKDKADVKAVQALLSNKVLGVSRANMHVPSSFTQASSSGINDVANWVFDDNVEISPADAEKAVREHAILQQEGEEWVEFAFSSRRDKVLLTNKRLVVMNVQGLRGTKIQFTSVPYQTIRAFGFQTSSGLLDRDEEVMIYTGVVTPPLQTEWTAQEIALKAGSIAYDAVGVFSQIPLPDLPIFEGSKEPCPSSYCVSYIRFDLSKKTGKLMDLHQFLSKKVLGGYPSSLIESEPEPTQSSGPLTDFLHVVGQNAQKIDVTQAEQMLKEANVLQDTERVLCAFKRRNDILLWSDRRFLHVDKQALRRRTMYFSLPYSSIKAFSFTSGGLRLDSEISMWTGIHWEKSLIEFDIRKGADAEEDTTLLADVMHLLGDKVIQQRVDLKSTAFFQKDSAPEGTADMVAYVGGDAEKLDNGEAESMFREQVPILLEDERVKFACRARRSTTLFTTTRAVRAKQNIAGRTKYVSVPFTSIGAFEARTKGSFDWDSEVQLYVETALDTDISQDFRADKVNILEVAEVLTALSTHRIEKLPQSRAGNGGRRVRSTERGQTRPKSRAGRGGRRGRSTEGVQKRPKSRAGSGGRGGRARRRE